MTSIALAESQSDILGALRRLDGKGTVGDVVSATGLAADDANDGAHFSAQVISSAFDGLSRVRQHQMVYGTLGDAMQGAVHALALRTLTPEQKAKQIQ